MIVEKIVAKGLVTFTLTNENGDVTHTQVENLIVDTGLAYIASRMIDTGSAVVSHMSVGTSSTAAADAQTALVTPLTPRVALTSTTNVTTTVTNDSVQYVAAFGPAVCTGAITEAGLFNALTAGTMIARTVFAVINKGAADTLTITWKISIA